LGGIKEFPFNLKKQLGKRSRKNILATLTDVYSDDAKLYPGMADLIRTLFATPGIRVGLVTRNITNEPMVTIRKALSRHDIDLDAFDFAVHVPLREEKTIVLRSARKSFDINPARAYACGDEHKDFTSAIAAGMHPFIGSYGFEDYTRLTKKFKVPEEVISRTPEDLSSRVLHALDIGQIG
jgi:phosphoglycolate phosphatase